MVNQSAKGESDMSNTCEMRDEDAVDGQKLCQECPDEDESEYPYCGGCGNPCSTKIIDDGIGGYEFWGSKGYDSQKWVGSDCCEDTLYWNVGLTREYDASGELYGD